MVSKQQLPVGGSVKDGTTKVLMLMTKPNPSPSQMIVSQVLKTIAEIHPMTPMAPGATLWTPG